MTIRKVTSLTASLAFVIMLATSIVLYIVPQGRVAYWADWRLWGLTKEQWGEIHINVGLLFLLALVLHIYYNWKPLMAYLKDRAKRMKILTPAFNMALLICLVTVTGTLLMLPPFSWVLDWNASIKEAGAQKYGEPPYGHAELASLTAFANKVGIDPALARKRLEQAGFQPVDGNQTLQALARLHHTTPKRLYAVMQEETQGAAMDKALPETPPPGTGRLSLAEICTTYGLDTRRVQATLERQNITAATTDSLRDIAERHGMGPVELYQTIRSAADAARKGG